MALTDLYLITTKNLPAFLTSILSAQAPEKFNQKFLESLEFTSTNDRYFIKMLKELGFVDPAGIPTNRYSLYLDQSQSKTVLAQAIREAYSDLFKVQKDAHNLDESAAKGKFKTLTGGKKSDTVYTLMAKTFVDLCKQADFKTPSTSIEQPKNKDVPEDVEEIGGTGLSKPMSLHYNIQLILPDTRDNKVYEAIFSSLRKHLG